jgi:murein DD-endopeptidase MepM/ murein hydrolase activator NlpD
LELEGAFRQGGLVTGKVEPGTTVRLDGQPVAVTPDGTFLIGFGRTSPEQLELRLKGPDGELRHRTLEVDPRDYPTQRINGLPERKVRPEPEDLKRIRRDRARVKEARGHTSDLDAFKRGFIWPVQGPITGVYGTRRILNGAPRQPHFGVDIAAPAGTPVQAPAGGVVRLAAPDLFFSGGTLILDHGHGLTSSFLHLRRFHVAAGDRVRRGQTIAEVGATGRVTGAHLDWRINLRGKRLDPALAAGPMPGESDPVASSSPGGGNRVREP